MREGLRRWAPGLAALLAYRRGDLGPDLRAGLAVAAVAIPVGIAYAELAGFPPEVGLYSSVFPLVAYAIFGSSRQLVLGPDAATCAVIAAAVAPLAAGDGAAYAALSAQLALLTGIFCILARFLRLGVLADFLSRPILVGFMNGIAITIVLGQLAKITGIEGTGGHVLHATFNLVLRLGETHPPTLLIALGAFGLMIAGGRLIPVFPAAVLAMAGAALAVFLLGLDLFGVKTLGVVPAGLPGVMLVQLDPEALAALLPAAGGLALVSFTSMMLASRSFASKNGYEVDPDKDFAALGAANVISALTHGFAISGADSRTAMADAAGGRTHATALFAALAVALVLLFLTAPLRYVPVAALGAVLVMAGLSLVDLSTLRLIARADRAEAAISILATLGVVMLGATQGILVAVVLALLRFLHISARPRVEILGRVAGMPGFHSLSRHQSATAPHGLVIFRFNGPLVFFNAGHFRHALLAATSAEAGAPKAVILDLLPVTEVDVTGLFTLKEVSDTLRQHGIAFVGAGRQTEWRNWMVAHGFSPDVMAIHPTLRHAVEALAAADTDGTAFGEQHTSQVS
ncbi:SulP family inorganic anion transporter [Xanthobacter autotrophicus]|uniref:SulP family inorganic anion transporter n=1 Tax=Xanthobacter TaxID=279 RepID=UPI0024AA7775|nr:SulP family inorganic anion transporter [Xanthobacter autotrophicus]MDI4664035.1 SulP family inorganic anion transporter [Xanthobacter autotrophicus]